MRTGSISTAFSSLVYVRGWSAGSFPRTAAGNRAQVRVAWKMENFITSPLNASLNIHTQSIKRELVRSLQKFTNRLECYNSMILLYYTIIYTMSFTVFATLWLLFGSVSQRLETTKFASLIG